MGAMSGMLGTGGGAGGTGFGKPTLAPVEKPTTAADVQGANQASWNNADSTNRLLAALQGGTGVSQGLTNAAGVGTNMQGQLSGTTPVTNPGLLAQNAAVAGQGGLNTNLAGNARTAGSQGFANTAGAAAGLGGLNAQMAGAAPVATGTGLYNQQGAVAGLGGLLGQQQGTAGMYQNIANGTGPNPAQAALNQATGQNVANQAALMAGQRGANANVGLQARQIAQQGANTQQQAAGQAATMQANQQLAGIQGLANQQMNMGNTLGQIGGLGTTQVGQQQAGLSTLGNLGLGQTGAQQAGITNLQNMGATQVGQNQAQQGINANIAQNQVGNALAGQGAATNAILGNQGNVLGGVQGQNAAAVGAQSSVNSANAAMAGARMPQQGSMIGGLMNAAGSALGMGTAKPTTTETQPTNTESASNGGVGGQNTSDSSSQQAPQQGSQAPDTVVGAQGGAVDDLPQVQPAAAVPLPTVQQIPQQQAPRGPVSAFGQLLSGIGKNMNGGSGSSAYDPIYAGASSLGGSDEASGKDPTGGKTNYGGYAAAGAAGAAGASGGAGMPSQPTVGNGLATNTGGATGNDTQRNVGTAVGEGPQNNGGFKISGSSGGGSGGTGGMAGGGRVSDFRGGGHVAASSPQEKAVAPGNSFKNDKIKAVLSEGEVVLPRSVMNSADPVRSAADFVSKVLAKRKRS